MLEIFFLGVDALSRASSIFFVLILRRHFISEAEVLTLLETFKSLSPGWGIILFLNFFNSLTGFGGFEFRVTVERG